MTEKRYFINSLQNIEDKQSGVILCGFSQIVERLNEYDEKYFQLFTEYSELQVENEQLKNEIKMLKSTIARNEAYITRLTKKGKWTK